MTPLQEQVRLLISQHRKQPVNILGIRELPKGEQGASGGEVRYFEAALETRETVPFVTKHATRYEREVLTHLAAHGLAIPPTYIPKTHSPKRVNVVQLFAPPKPDNLPDCFTRGYAKRLAEIHTAFMGNAVPWLETGAIRNLYLEPWRDEWMQNLEFAEFSRDFGRYTASLELAFATFAEDMQSLMNETESNTLINSDLHPTHMRLLDGEPCFIDWEQARFGPFYLDLVNYFQKETALVYRDELAAQGYCIPPVDFLDRFHAMGRYMGFRYLGVGLTAWREQHTGKAMPLEYWAAKRWFLYYCLELARNGR